MAVSNFKKSMKKIIMVKPKLPFAVYMKDGICWAHSKQYRELFFFFKFNYKVFSFHSKNKVSPSYFLTLNGH